MSRCKIKKAETAMPFFPDVAHRHNYPVTCLDHICLQVYYMLHKTVSEMNPFTSYPAAKHQKAQQAERYKHLKK